MKGHVTLGSQRVRQDYMIAEGLLAPYETDDIPADMLEMSLARIRQLSAHEVGHTLGFAHNFAGSTQDRASVMDYPFPRIRIDEAGNIDLSDAYAVGMGEWDRRSVMYVYQDFPDGVDAEAARNEILEETLAMGLRFVSDGDSRDPGTAHPWGNVWDNGDDAVSQLEHLLQVREIALDRFSEHNIRPGRPMASLEEALVPVYLLHRYQIAAVGKLIGGHYFDYALRGDTADPVSSVAAAEQRRAIGALLDAIDPAVLRLSDALLDKIPARPPGHRLTREAFPRRTGATFDPVAPAQTAVALTLDTMLHAQRAARMVAAHAREPELPGFDELTSSLLEATWFSTRLPGMDGVIQRATNMLVLERLLILSANPEASSEVRGLAMDAVIGLQGWLEDRVRESDPTWRAHFASAANLIRQSFENPASILEIPPITVPPGSPIGAATDFDFESQSGGCRF
jgi:hypothetical protein